MSILLVQNTNTTGSGITQLIPTFSSTPTNGNSLFLITSSSLSTVSSVTSTGATWSKAIAQENGVASDIEIWYAVNVSSAGSAVTVNYGASSKCVAMIAEFSGILLTPLDKTASNTGAASPLDSGTTATTTTANQLWIAGFAGQVPSGSLTFSGPTNGFTLQDQADPITFGGCWSYKIVATTGIANTGVSGAATWAGVIATFSGTGVPIVEPMWDVQFVPQMNLANQMVAV